MSHNIELKEGAFIVSDAHYSHLRPELLQLMQDIESKKLRPTQLILMGDIFDALFGDVERTHTINELMLASINAISQSIEVIYLEGNHDFNLAKLFPHAKVFSFKMQPVIATYGSKKVALAHGDFDGTLSYQIYTALIRSRIVMWILKSFDSLFNHVILNKLDSYLGKKDDCKEFRDFREFIQRRHLEKYECDYFVEGHFHQNRSFTFEKFHYINLAAFACNQRCFIVESLKDKELLKEKIFSKEI